MIDTHTHIYLPEFSDEISGIMDKCEKSGISHLILPNVDQETFPLMKDFHQRYPKNTSMALGIHPTEIKEGWEQSVEFVEKEIENGDYIAVGEVGIDLYWDVTHIDYQKEAFQRQLKIAEKKNLPVIIHSRSAYDETLEVIGMVKPTIPLIFHSFTGNTENVKKIRTVCDPYFGINGVITYKNAEELRNALSIIGLDRILLETDSPYLTPIPHRGKQNNSLYLNFIRDKIAETLQLSPEEIENQTDRNARSVFGI